MPPSSTLPPPAPGALPVLGHQLAWRRDPLRLLTRARAECGDVVSLSFGGSRCVLLAHPDDIARVHLQWPAGFQKAQGGYVFPRAFGNGLLTSKGELWRRQRSLAQPAFQRRRIGGYAALMAQLAGEAVAQWPDGSVIDIHAQMSRLAQRIAGMTLFAVDTGGWAAEVSVAMDVINRAVNTESRSLISGRLPASVPTANRRRADGAIGKLDALVRQLLQERASRPDRRDDLLASLAGAGAGQDPRQLRDEIVTLYLAGHETTANTLSWLWYLLARDPAAADRVACELADVLGDRPATPDDLAGLRFTRAAIDEAMRLYPPIWQVFRVAAQEAGFGSFSVPAGTGVMMSQWLTHRDPRWFGDPDRFDPGRWLDGRTEGLPRYAFFPFGGGPRVCIGSAFALLEAALVVATIARRVRLRPAGPQVRPAPHITLRPARPMLVRVSKR